MALNGQKLNWKKHRKRYLTLIRRGVMPFALPIFIELSCVVLMGIISTILVSHLGKSEIAAVGISDSVTWIIISLLAAISLGGSVVVSHGYGALDSKKTKDGSRHVIMFSLAISVVCLGLVSVFAGEIVNLVAPGAEADVKNKTIQFLSIIAYSYPALAIIFSVSGVLRAVGNSRTPAKVNISMNVLNVVFSYPLIYGVSFLDIAGLGVVGAGIGMTASRSVGAIALLYTANQNHSIRLKLNSLTQSLNRNLIKEISVIGIPASVESLMFNIGKLITQMMVAGLGTASMAANVITFSVLLFINLPGNALSTTATMLISRRMGQNRKKAAYIEMQLIFWLSSILLVVFAFLTVPFAYQIAGIYTQLDEVAEIVVNLIIINAFMTVIWSASFVLPAALKGAKDVKFGMWVAIISMWGCRIIAGYLLGIQLGYGIYGVWFGMFFDWWVRGVCYIYRAISLKWM